MENTTPLFKKLYPLLKIKLKTLQKYLKKNLVKRWIKYSESLTVSPTIFIPKKNGFLRLYVNY